MSLRFITRSQLWPRAPVFTASMLALQAAVFDEWPAARERAVTAPPPAPFAGQQVWRLGRAPPRTDRYQARLSNTLARLMRAMDWPEMHLVGLARNIAWDAGLAAVDAPYPPLARALARLRSLGLPAGFKGALVFAPQDCASVLPAWFWLSRCGPPPYSLHCGVPGQAFVGNLCQHGNLHLEFHDGSLMARCNAAAQACGLEAVAGTCREAFGRNGRISGRGLVV